MHLSMLTHKTIHSKLKTWHDEETHTHAWTGLLSSCIRCVTTGTGCCRVSFDRIIPAHKKWRGIILYLRTVWVSIYPSIRGSVSFSFPDSNLSIYWPIFFKLCMDIDIKEEWFGIANGLNSYINNSVMALDWCKNVFFPNIFRTNGWILIKFCRCIDIYKIHVVSNAHYFWSIFNRVMALDRRQNFVYAQDLVN